jgi:integrase
MGVSIDFKTLPLTVDEDDFQEFLAFREFKRRAALRATAPQPGQRTVGEMWTEWLAVLGPVAKKNRTSQGRHLYRPFRHRGEDLVMAGLTPEECTEAVLTSWQAMLADSKSVLHKGRKLSPGTVHQVRMGLQSMFKHYVKLKELRWNPLREVDKVPGRDRHRKGYTTPEDVERYAAAMPVIGGYIVRHLFATGFRIVNQLTLQKHQIDRAAGGINVVQKGGTDLFVPVADVILAEMEHLCATSPGPWVYPNPRDPQRSIPYETFTGWSRRARKKTGLAPNGEPIVPHHLRHGVAMDMLDHEADLTEVQAALGHSDIKLTARYAKLRGAAVERLRARQNSRFAK